MRTYIFAVLFSVVLLLAACSPAGAQTAKVGMHVLSMEEVEPAVTLLREQDKNQDDWYYITIPFTLQDLGREDEWQQFFSKARDWRVIPIVRLATSVEGDHWVIPTRKDIVDQLEFLGRLEWPTPERRIIFFNEVNHAQEWGNTLDATQYTDLFRFGAQWAKSMQKNYLVMMAAMDLAAPNGTDTHEAFRYLDEMAAADPEIFRYLDAWNSHSYPNPAFSAPPQRQGQDSLYGYRHELAFLEAKKIQPLPVYITETGWQANRQTDRKLVSYYRYALDHIWQPDDRVVAVTPFVFAGSPGPFSGFSFVGADGKPTLHYTALKQVLGAETEK